MATFFGLPPVRDDFRCSLCRQKNTFHCEHDTPYRDQLLGTYEQEKSYMMSRNSRRDVQPAGLHNNNNKPTNNRKIQNINIERNINSNARTQYQQVRRPENDSLSSPDPNPNLNGSIRTNEQPKKNKSCVIL